MTSVESRALRRLQLEAKNFPADNAAIALIDCSETMQWRIKIAGSPGTLYAGEEFFLQVPLPVQLSYLPLP